MFWAATPRILLYNISYKSWHVNGRIEFLEYCVGQPGIRPTGPYPRGTPTGNPGARKSWAEAATPMGARSMAD